MICVTIKMSCVLKHERLIVDISGFTGSGKTVLTGKLFEEEIIPNASYIYDFAKILLPDFLKYHSRDEIQKYFYEKCCFLTDIKSAACKSAPFPTIVREIGTFDHRCYWECLYDLKVCATQPIVQDAENRPQVVVLLERNAKLKLDDRETDDYYKNFTTLEFKNKWYKIMHRQLIGWYSCRRYFIKDSMSAMIWRSTCSCCEERADLVIDALVKFFLTDGYI